MEWYTVFNLIVFAILVAVANSFIDSILLDQAQLGTAQVLSDL